MITQLIIVIACVLAIVAPVMFLVTISKGNRFNDGIDNGESTVWKYLVYGLISWTILVFGLTKFGVFEYVDGDVLPRFLLGLFIPASALLLLLFNSAFIRVLDRVPLYYMIGAQFFRLFGIVFFLVASSGMGPQAFTSSGYGDALTGILAVLAAYMVYRNLSGAKYAAWGFTVVGLLDLLNVSQILLRFYPIWTDMTPSTAEAGAYPLMLIVGITAPIALVLHVYTLRALLRTA